MQLLSNLNCLVLDWGYSPWLRYMATGAAQTGRKEKPSLLMLQVLISLLHASMRLTALVDHMTKIAHVADAHDVGMTN